LEYKLKIGEPILQQMWDAQHETTLWAPTACYGDSFTFLYVDDIRPWQDTQVWESTACYGDSYPYTIAVDSKWTRVIWTVARHFIDWAVPDFAIAHDG
jgi:hypothetical protein